MPHEMEALIFDCLTFTLATGSPSTAVEYAAAVAPSQVWMVQRLFELSPPT